MSDADTPLELVRRFCALWPTLDLQGDLKPLLDFFTDDAVYHNIPVDPVTGKHGIRSTITMFATGVNSIEFRVDNIAADGSVVMTERVGNHGDSFWRDEFPLMVAWAFRR